MTNVAPPPHSSFVHSSFQHGAGGSKTARIKPRLCARKTGRQAGRLPVPAHRPICGTLPCRACRNCRNDAPTSRCDARRWRSGCADTSRRRRTGGKVRFLVDYVAWRSSVGRSVLGIGGAREKSAHSCGSLHITRSDARRLAPGGGACDARGRGLGVRFFPPLPAFRR